MRFLPYVLIALMAAPAVIWTSLELFIIPTQATPFTPTDLIKIASLGLLAVLAMSLLGRWMSRQIAKHSS